MTATHADRIFISYRRDDSAGYAGRLYDDLVEQVGAERVFRDIDTIEPGQDFVNVLEKTLTSISALLVVIGPKWIDITDSSGNRRLDNPGDFVRMEVGRALSSDVRVIPVLVEDASMPRAAELPADLQSLTRRQYQELSDSRWDYDVGQLIASLDTGNSSASRLSRRSLAAAGAGVLLLVGASATAWRLWPDSNSQPAGASAGTSDTSIPQTARHVPAPAFANYLIPDNQTNAWDDQGPRIVRGVVFHRIDGTLEEADQYLRQADAGILTDIGVGHESGQIRMWNDPQGLPHDGVSPNRAPWANGPVSNPGGDAPQFISLYGAEAINRDLVSITVTGDVDDPLSDACNEALAHLTAYYADLAEIGWADFPHVVDDGYMFVMLHSEFAANRACPGQALTAAAAGIVDRAGEILRQYQTGV